MNIFNALLACAYASLAYGQFLQTGIFDNTLQIPFQNDIVGTYGLYDPQTNSINSGLLNVGLWGGQGGLQVQGWGAQGFEGHGLTGQEKILPGNSFRGRSHHDTRRYKRSPDNEWGNRRWSNNGRGRGGRGRGRENRRWRGRGGRGRGRGGRGWRGRGDRDRQWGGRGDRDRRWGGRGRGGRDRGGRGGRFRGRGRDKRSADNLLHLYSN